VNLDQLRIVDARRTEMWALDLTEQEGEQIAREIIGDADITEALSQGVRYVFVTRDPAVGVIAIAIDSEEFRSLSGATSRLDTRDTKLHVVRPRTSWLDAIRRGARRIVGGAP
jgi:hypothetical protein